MEKVILGIDPGTNLMGYGVLRVSGRQAEMIALGVIDLRRYADHYMKLGHIFERVSGIIQAYLPDELASGSAGEHGEGKKRDGKRLPAGCI